MQTYSLAPWQIVPDLPSPVRQRSTAPPHPPPNGAPRPRPARYLYTYRVSRVWYDTEATAPLPSEEITVLGKNASRAWLALQIRQARRGYGLVKDGLVRVQLAGHRTARPVLQVIPAHKI